MSTTTTSSGGTATSFTNTPQARDDSYTYLEDLLRSNSTLYNAATNTLTLDVMSNDLGGNAKSLFSVEDGDGNALTSDFDLLARDVDASGCSRWEATLNGNWVRINNGKIEYRIADGSGIPGQGASVDALNAGEMFADQFVYAIRLGNGTLSQATVRISITGANDLATITSAASGDYQVTEAGGAANGLNGDPAAGGRLIVSDADDGEAVFRTPASLDGSYGSFAFDPLTGVWSYTLDQARADQLPQGEQVQEALTVTSADGTATHTITVTLTGTNDAPVATAATAMVFEDGTVTGQVVGTDVDRGATLTYALVDAAPTGLTFNSDGSWSFDASSYDYLPEGQTLQLAIPYRATDQHGASSTASLVITITGTNDTPVAEAASAAIDEDALVTGQVVATDADNNASLTFALVDAAPAGLTFNSDGRWSFDASSYDYLPEGQTLELAILYTVTDQHGASTTADLVITLTGTNDTPVAEAASAAVDEDALVTGHLVATDADAGARLTYALVNAAPTGLSLDENGSWSFDASSYDYLAEGQPLELTIPYTATDQHGASATSNLVITITGTNDEPIVSSAIVDQLSPEDSEWSFIVPAETFSDVDGDSLTLSATLASGSPLPAWLTFNPADQTFTGTPPQDYNGSLEVTVTATDGLTQVSDTFVLTISPVNDAPVNIAPASVTATEDTFMAIAGVSVSDVDNAVLTTTLSVDHGMLRVFAASGLTITGNDSGTVVLHGTASAINTALEGLRYLGDINFNGSDTLSIVTSDGAAIGSDTVPITVTPVNDAPGQAVPFQDLPHGLEDASLTLTQAQLTQGFEDPEGDAMLASQFTVTNGTLVHNSDGSITITPLANFNGPVSLTYAVEDSNGLWTPVTRSIVIDPVNDAPVLDGAAAVLAGGTEDNSYIVTQAQLLQGWSDVDGDPLAVSDLTASNGTVTLNADGSYTITPSPDFNGQVTLSYEVGDGTTSVPASLSYSLAPVNDEASIGGTAAGTVAEQVGPAFATGSLTVDDRDGEEESEFVPATMQGAYGTLVLLADGSWRYDLNETDPDLDTLDSGESVVEAFLVETADGTTAQIEVKVFGANEAPQETRMNDAINDRNFDDPSQIAWPSGTIVDLDDFNGSQQTADRVIGGSADQRLNGNNGSDMLHGAGGNDNISGGGDADTLYGGAGNDIINGGGGADTIYGGSGNDTIGGDGQNEIIYAGSGNDDVQGHGGADQLWGGTGQDDFIFEATDSAPGANLRDTINDFSHAEGDRIDISAMTSFLASGWVGQVGSSAQLAAGQTGYVVNADGSLTVYGEVAGAGDFAVNVIGVGSLQASDFIFGGP